MEGLENPFKSCKYYVIKCDNQEAIKLLDSVFASSNPFLSESLKFAISDDESNLENGEAEDIYAVPVVTSNWVILSFKIGKFLPTKFFNPSYKPLFNNTKMVLTELSLADRINLTGTIKVLGGVVEKDLNQDITHLITGLPKGAMYDYLKNNDLLSQKIVVTPDWIYDSIEKKTLLSPDEYNPSLLKLPEPKPVKPKSPPSHLQAPSQSTNQSDSSCPKKFSESAPSQHPLANPSSTSTMETLMQEQSMQHHQALINRPQFNMTMGTNVAAANTSVQQILSQGNQLSNQPLTNLSAAQMGPKMVFTSPKKGMSSYGEYGLMGSGTSNSTRAPKSSKSKSSKHPQEQNLNEEEKDAIVMRNVMNILSQQHNWKRDSENNARSGGNNSNDSFGSQGGTQKKSKSGSTQKSPARSSSGHNSANTTPLKSPKNRMQPQTSQSNPQPGLYQNPQQQLSFQQGQKNPNYQRGQGAGPNVMAPSQQPSPMKNQAYPPNMLMQQQQPNLNQQQHLPPSNIQGLPPNAVMQNMVRKPNYMPNDPSKQPYLPSNCGMPPRHQVPLHGNPPPQPPPPPNMGHQQGPNQGPQFPNNMTHQPKHDNSQQPSQPSMSQSMNSSMMMNMLANDKPITTNVPTSMNNTNTQSMAPHENTYQTQLQYQSKNMQPERQVDFPHSMESPAIACNPVFSQVNNTPLHQQPMSNPPMMPPSNTAPSPLPPNSPHNSNRSSPGRVMQSQIFNSPQKHQQQQQQQQQQHAMMSQNKAQIGSQPNAQQMLAMNRNLSNQSPNMIPSMINQGEMVNSSIMSKKMPPNMPQQQSSQQYAYQMQKPMVGRYDDPQMSQQQQHHQMPFNQMLNQPPQRQNMAQQQKMMQQGQQSMQQNPQPNFPMKNVLNSQFPGQCLPNTHPGLMTPSQFQQQQNFMQQKMQMARLSNQLNTPNSANVPYQVQRHNIPNSSQQQQQKQLSQYNQPQPNQMRMPIHHQQQQQQQPMNRIQGFYQPQNQPPTPNMPPDQMSMMGENKPFDMKPNDYQKAPHSVSPQIGLMVKNQGHGLVAQQCQAVLGQQKPTLPCPNSMQQMNPQNPMHMMSQQTQMNQSILMNNPNMIKDNPQLNPQHQFQNNQFNRHPLPHQSPQLPNQQSPSNQQQQQHPIQQNPAPIQPAISIPTYHTVCGSPVLEKENDCFFGCVILLAGYNDIDPSVKAKWKKVMRSKGAEVIPYYDSEKVTHLVIDWQLYDPDLFKQALRDQKRFVTIHWINDVISMRKQIVPNDILHLPSPFSPSCTFSFIRSQIITTTGFVGKEKVKVEFIIKQVGAKYTDYMDEANTILICKKPCGQKFEAAQSWGIPCVNVRWLQDFYLGDMSALSVDISKHYLSFEPADVCMSLDLRTIRVLDLMVGWRKPITMTQELYEYHEGLKNNYMKEGDEEDKKENMVNDVAQKSHLNPLTNEEIKLTDNCKLLSERVASDREKYQQFWTEKTLLSKSTQPTASISNESPSQKEPTQTAAAAVGVTPPVEGQIMIKEEAFKLEDNMEVDISMEKKTETLASQSGHLVEEEEKMEISSIKEEINLDTDLNRKRSAESSNSDEPVKKMPTPMIKQEDVESFEKSPMEEAVQQSMESESKSVPEREVPENSPSADAERAMKVEDEFSFNESTKIKIAMTGLSLAQRQELTQIILSMPDAEVVDEMHDATHLIAEKVVRVPKFYLALAQSKFICSYKWILASKMRGKWLNEADWILSDPEGEAKMNFNLRESLLEARRRKIECQPPLFKGIEFWVSKATRNRDVCIQLIKLCGGILRDRKPMKKMVITVPPKQVFICHEDEYASAIYLLKTKAGSRGVHHEEFILSNVIRQTLDFESYQIRHVASIQEELQTTLEMAANSATQNNSHLTSPASVNPAKNLSNIPLQQQQHQSLNSQNKSQLPSTGPTSMMNQHQQGIFMSNIPNSSNLMPAGPNRPTGPPGQMLSQQQQRQLLFQKAQQQQQQQQQQQFHGNQGPFQDKNNRPFIVFSNSGNSQQNINLQRQQQQQTRNRFLAPQSQQEIPINMINGSQQQNSLSQHPHHHHHQQQQQQQQFLPQQQQHIMPRHQASNNNQAFIQQSLRPNTNLSQQQQHIRPQNLNPQPLQNPQQQHRQLQNQNSFQGNALLMSPTNQPMNNNPNLQQYSMMNSNQNFRMNNPKFNSPLLHHQQLQQTSQPVSQVIHHRLPMNVSTGPEGQPQLRSQMPANSPQTFMAQPTSQLGVMQTQQQMPLAKAQPIMQANIDEASSGQNEASRNNEPTTMDTLLRNPSPSLEEKQKTPQPPLSNLNDQTTTGKGDFINSTALESSVNNVCDNTASTIACNMSMGPPDSLPTDSMMDSQNVTNISGADNLTNFSQHINKNC